MKKNKKASALIVAILILSVMLLIGLSVSLTAIKSQKSSVESEKSSVAYQIAESGVEDVMERLLNRFTINPSTKLSDNSIGCSNSSKTVKKNISGGSYEVSFFVNNSGVETPINSCSSTNVSDVTRIKSVGSFQTDTRSLTAPVVFPIP